MKREVRVMGIDDAPFDKRDKGRKTFIVGTIYRGGDFLDGVVSIPVTIDGDDSTQQIIAMINRSKFKTQLQCIFLNGIAVAGFNVVDVHNVVKATGIPLVTVIRRQPDMMNIHKTLEKIGYKHKILLLAKAGPVQKVGKIYIQAVGLSLAKAKEFLDLTCTHSLIPEPLRVAHIIAAGIVKGESKGKARSAPYFVPL